MQLVLTPAEMAAADQHAIASGTPEAVLVERAGPRGRPARAAHARRDLRAARHGRRGQGQQRCRRARRGAAPARAGRGRRRAPARTTASTTPALARGRTRRPRDRRDVRHGIPRARSKARRRRCSRPRTHRTAVPVLAVDIPSGVNGATGAVGRRRRCARDETICFAAYKPGLAVRTGTRARGPGDAWSTSGSRWTRRDAALAVLDARDLALADTRRGVAQVVVGLPRGRRVERHGRARRCSRAGPRCACGAGMVVCAVPGAAAAAQVSGQRARRARVARHRRRRARRKTRPPRC